MATLILRTLNPATAATSGASSTKGSALTYDELDQNMINLNVDISTKASTTSPTITGTVTATAFSGSGASLTSLNAGNISTGTLAIARGGTNGSATPTAGAIAYGTGTAYAFTAAGTSGELLVSGGSGVPTWSGSISAGLIGSGTLAIARGGTNGSATPTAGAIAYGNGTSYAFTAAGTLNQVLTSNGSGAPTWSDPPSGVTLSTDNTNTTRYVMLASGTGTLTTGYVDDTTTPLSYNPSTSTLTASVFSGALAASNLTGTVAGGRGVTAGSASASFVTYNGTTKTAGQFDGGTTDPSNTTRLNYDGHFYATKFFGDGSGLTGVGLSVSDDTTTNSSHYLTFTTSTSGSLTSTKVSSTKLYFNPNSGTLNATSFNSLSDIRLKENIAPITNSIDVLNQIDGVQFTWKDSGNQSYGVIAQQLETIIPDLVDGNDTKTVNYSGLIAFLINAVKDLDKRVKQLENHG